MSFQCGDAVWSMSVVSISAMFLLQGILACRQIAFADSILVALITAGYSVTSFACAFITIPAAIWLKESRTETVAHREAPSETPVPPPPTPEPA